MRLCRSKKVGKTPKEFSMSKVFVLQKVGWEYNDENWYRPEDQGGTPIKVYHDKKKANDAAIELTANSDNFKGEWATPFQYCDLNHNYKKLFVEFNDKLIEIFGDKVKKVVEDDFYDWHVPKNATLDQRKQLVEIFEEFFDIVFFEVVEVESDE